MATETRTSSLMRYSDGVRIGTVTMTESEYEEWEGALQQPQGLIRLGDLPHRLYDLDEEYQDASPDTTVYYE